MYTKIGYARVSTADQNLDLQIDALNESGCLKIFSEKKSGASKDRPELENLLDQLRPNDIVVVWKLDRLARSLKDLIQLINEFHERGAGFISLSDNIDTSTPQGKLIFHIFGALAEFEREIISERTKAGLAAARARGRKGGRPKGLTAEAKRKARLAETYYSEGEMTIQQICDSVGVSKKTLYKYLRFRGVEV